VIEVWGCVNKMHTSFKDFRLKFAAAEFGAGRDVGRRYQRRIFAV
jgi:hypothetical protein